MSAGNENIRTRKYLPMTAQTPFSTPMSRKMASAKNHANATGIATTLSTSRQRSKVNPTSCMQQDQYMYASHNAIVVNRYLARTH